MSSLQEWAVANKMCFHLDKCKAQKYLTKPMLVLYIASVELEHPYYKEKDLGV